MRTSASPPSQMQSFSIESIDRREFRENDGIGSMEKGVGGQGFNGVEIIAKGARDDPNL
ncbi:hypothetical protein QJS04_geneDACA014521 [Acorus gramineus]|uniref:Uncharacterized protein n=1 Tax=Acorus gramineus TaxID=55184 RepID=A0AAV9AS30_ACOGR|nr:hypothetical protein QJS04_geneDACA014521 [Acorus gramineus]